MFPIQMSGQRDKLVAALGAMVSNADGVEISAPVIEQLGRDHRRFLGMTEQYLMATLKRFLGPAWDAELADTWAPAYGLIAKIIVAAAEGHEDEAPDDWQADVMRVEPVSMVCGPPPMVRHTVRALKAAGVPADAIRRQQFDFGTTSPTEESNPWETAKQWKAHS